MAGRRQEIVRCGERHFRLEEFDEFERLGGDLVLAARAEERSFVTEAAGVRHLRRHDNECRVLHQHVVAFRVTDEVTEVLGQWTENLPSEGGAGYVGRDAKVRRISFSQWRRLVAELVGGPSTPAMTDDARPEEMIPAAAGPEAARWGAPAREARFDLVA